jgi:two-component system, sensor histidine kinase
VTNTAANVDKGASERAPSPGNFDALVRMEQVRLLYRQLPVSVSGTLLAVVVLAVTHWDVLPHGLIIGWGMLMFANQSWRLGLYSRFRKEGLKMELTDRWAAYWATGSGISGVIWGAASVLFFVPHSPLHQTILVVMVFAVTAVAVPLIASHRPSFYAFVLPTLLPTVARNLWEGDTLHYTIAFIGGVVTVLILTVGRNYHAMLVSSLRTRFENEALATELARQNADVEAARRIAEDASRSKTQFFAAASHDLRQPLHAMGLFAAALSEKVREPEVRHVVDSINASVQALEGLFNELLDVSKIDSGVIKPELTSFQVDQVFNRLREEFAAEAHAKGLELSIISAGELVLSDAVLLERIIRNLLGNALRYTPAGQVVLSASRAVDRIVIEVRDTGLGIQPDDQARIYDEFFQLSNPGRTSRKGLGLGLSIVKRLCGLLGYELRLTSEYGKGSVFSFDVPPGEAAQPQRASPGPASTFSDLSGKLIVVVDDEAAIVEAMRTLLAAWGAKVIGSPTGDDVMSTVHAAGQLPDLLIVDYRLGARESGIDIAQRLRRELDPEIPAVLVTGSITSDLEERARSAGLRFLLKPVTPAALRECIESSLNTRLASSKA